MRSLVLAAVAFALATIATAQIEAWATDMGRARQSAEHFTQFDFNGFALAVTWKGNVAALYINMSQTHTNGSVGVVSPQHLARRATILRNRGVHQEPIPWEPNWFVAALYEVANFTSFLATNFTALPPPLNRAVATMNFTSEKWSSGVMQTIPVFAGLNMSQSYVVYLVKADEPDWNQPSFGPNFVSMQAWTLHSDAEQSVAPVAKPLTQASATHRRNIEFVGDSLTAGYCNMCSKDVTYHSEDYLKTWSFLVAQSFGAQYHTEAWSGYGVVRNCCGGDVMMPEIFERTLATVDRQDWQWDSFVPDVMVINLGANDHLNNTFPGPFEEEWVRTYVDFVNRTALSRYLPLREQAGRTEPLHMFLACAGAQWSPVWCPYVVGAKAALEDIAAAMQPVPNVKYHFFWFDMPRADFCCGHPNLAGDRAMADQVIATIEKEVGWTVENRV
jgi:hypothetical protein